MTNEKPVLSNLTKYAENFKQANKLFHSANRPTTVYLEPDDTIYKIDLNSRTIEAPEFLAVKSDHEAEIVFFEMDRYYDGVDLSTTSCIVQYKTIDKNSGKEIYSAHVIPFYDVYSKADQFKIIIPWDITNNVSQTASTITFSFRFFKVDDNLNLSYNLNTLPASSKILDTLSDNPEIPSDSKIPSTILDEIIVLYNYLDKNSAVYWEIVE